MSWTYVDYHTGNGLINFRHHVDIIDVENFADAHATYTRKDITILSYTDVVDSETHLTGTRQWHDGVEYKDEFKDKKPIKFGKLGYYSDWHYTMSYEAGLRIPIC